MDERPPRYVIPRGTDDADELAVSPHEPPVPVHRPNADDTASLFALAAREGTTVAEIRAPGIAEPPGPTLILPTDSVRPTVMTMHHVPKTRSRAGTDDAAVTTPTTPVSPTTATTR